MAQDLEAASQSVIDRYLKVIDVPIDGDEPRQVAVKASGQNNGLVSFEPPSAPPVLRLTFDDVPRNYSAKFSNIHGHLEISRPPVEDHGDKEGLYAMCTNQFRTTYKPHTNYENGTNIPSINFSKLYSHSALHRLFEQDVQREWFAVEVFACHTCRRSRMETRVVAFTMIEGGRGNSSNGS